MRTTTAALIPAWALTLSLIPAAVVFGQPSPETPETPWCEVLMPEPADGPESVYQYSLVPVPEGSSTEIGILFLYTDLLARDDVERRTDYWIQRSNSMLSRAAHPACNSSRSAYCRRLLPFPRLTASLPAQPYFRRWAWLTKLTKIPTSRRPESDWGAICSYSSTTSVRASVRAAELAPVRVSGLRWKVPTRFVTGLSRWLA